MSNAHMVEIAVARFSCCPQMTQSAKVQFSSYTVFDHIVVDTSHLFHLLTKTMTVHNCTLPIDFSLLSTFVYKTIHVVALRLWYIHHKHTSVQEVLEWAQYHNVGLHVCMYIHLVFGSFQTPTTTVVESPNQRMFLKPEPQIVV